MRVGRPCGNAEPLAAETGQVIVDTARAIRPALGHCAPEDGLRVFRIGTRFPAQQPVAAPSLVLLEDVAEFAGQRPGLEGVISCYVLGQRAQRWARHQAWVAQRRVQPPAQRLGIEIVGAAADVGRQCTRNEFARGQEFQVGGNAVLGRERGLQPAPHRHLRDQDGFGRQQRLPRRRLPQLFGEQSGQHFQRIGMVKAEIGKRGRHPAILPEPPWPDEPRLIGWHDWPAPGTGCFGATAQKLCRVAPECDNTARSSSVKFSRRDQFFRGFPA